MNDSDPFRFDDAAYVMGALSESETAAFEAHLRTCPECALRVDELRPMVDALAGIDPVELDADPETVPDTLLPRLIREVDSQRRRQRWVLSGLAAATAACVIALVVAFWPGASGSGSPTPGPTVRFQAVAAAPVDATAVLTAKKWGTRVDLQCTGHGGAGGPGGYGDGGTYRLVIVAKDGTKVDAGNWTESGGADVNYVTGTALTPDEIAMMQIVAQDGTVLLDVTL